MQLVFTYTDYSHLSLDEQCQWLKTFFDSKIGEIDRQLVRDLSFISQLAHYQEGMKVIKVETLPAGKDLAHFYLYFEYEWHIFHGCMAMEDEGVMADKVKFTVDSSDFPCHILSLDLTPFQTLSTADEL